MKNSAKTRSEQILTVMPILAWVAFVGLLIKAGAIIFTYGISCVNPEATKNLYRGLNLYDLKQFNFWHYTLTVSFIVALTGMKAFISFLAIKVLSKVNLVNPFKMEVAMILEKISYVLFADWVIAMVSNLHTSWLQEKTGTLHIDWVSGESIFMAALVLIISQIFKRGIEIQTENDLTV